MRKWFSGTENAIEIYIVFDDGKVSDECFEKAFAKVAGIIRATRQAKEKPWLKDCYYIRGILRNRFKKDGWQMMTWLEEYCERGVTTSKLKDLACRASSWNDFLRNADELARAAAR